MTFLEYNGSDKVVIGTHTSAEHRFQLANHYNLVDRYVKTAETKLEKFIRANVSKLSFDQRIELDNILQDIGNANIQHFNLGQEILEIKELEITRKWKKD